MMEGRDNVDKITCLLKTSKTFVVRKMCILMIIQSIKLGLPFCNVLIKENFSSKRVCARCRQSCRRSAVFAEYRN